MSIFLNLFLGCLLLLNGFIYAQNDTSKEVQPPAATPPSYPFLVEEAQPAGKEDNFTRDLVQMVITLGIITAIIFMMTWFLKRMLNTRIQQMNVSSGIKILERRALTPKSSLYLLDVKGKGMVVAESTNGLVKLSDFDLEEALPQKRSFSETLLKKNEME